MKSFASSLISSQYGESNSNSPEEKEKDDKIRVRANLGESERKDLHCSHRKKADYHLLSFNILILSENMKKKSMTDCLPTFENLSE